MDHDPVVLLGDRRIGADAPCFVIAELGVNHNGDVATALELVDAAADAGADAVKLQTFDPDLLAATSAPLAAYQAVSADGSQHELLRGLKLTVAEHVQVRSHAERRGVVFLSTPFDVLSARMLLDLGVSALKVGSGEVTNLPLLRAFAELGLPIVLSTGMSTLEEVAAALDAIAESRDVPVVLLHCVSSYPADPADANLRAMATMREHFGVPVGFSDHTTGLEVAFAAVALGAAIIEKHLTLDRTAPGPDHRASLEPDDFASLVRGIRSVEGALGSGVKAPVAAEADVAAVARRSVATSHDLEAGSVLGAGDLTLLRPGTGMAPSTLAGLVGRRLRRTVPSGTLLSPEDLQ